MKPQPPRRSATPDEFFHTVEIEFSFLGNEHGYKLTQPKNELFTVVYEHGSKLIRVTGINYGFGAHLEAWIDGEYLPLWPLMSDSSERKSPVTEKPQLDDLREYAWRLKHECADIVKGDFSRVDRIHEAIRRNRRSIEEKEQQAKWVEFFKAAEKLFNTKRFAECVEHLSTSPYKLPPIWEGRLKYAMKHIVD
jgi:hypothetical protein